MPAIDNGVVGFEPALRGRPATEPFTLGRMNHRVFHINAEIRPVTDATLDPEEVAGAAVRCLVPGDTPDDALSALSDRFVMDGLELVETEWCVDFDETEWENSGGSDEELLADEVRRTGEVQYGTFHTWGHDAPDAT